MPEPEPVPEPVPEPEPGPEPEAEAELVAEAEEMSNKMRRQLKLLNIDMSKMKPLETKGRGHAEVTQSHSFKATTAYPNHLFFDSMHK